jgi:hypothetical protein
VAIAAAVFAFAVGTHLADRYLLASRVRLLDSSRAGSYSHVLSTTAMAAATLAAAMLALSAAGTRRRASLTASVLFGALLLDNLTRFHQRIPAWPVVFVPLLAGLCAAALVLASGTSEHTVVAAGFCVLLASFAVHVLGPPALRAAGWGPSSWAYEGKIAVKEGLELAGWTLLAPALVRLARRAAPSPRSAALRRLRAR